MVKTFSVNQLTAQYSLSRLLYLLKAGKPDWNTVNRIPSISLFSESLNSDSDSEVPLISCAHKPPSVTRVLSQSMSAEARFNLKQWEQRKVDELGFAEFQIYRKSKSLANLSII